MKMLNNVLGAGVFASSRPLIQSPRSTKMGEGDLRYAARPPERPVQVHRHHAEDGAVAVAEPVDGVEPVDEVVVYKNRDLSSTVPVLCVAVVNTRWDANANGPGLDDPPNDDGV